MIDRSDGVDRTILTAEPGQFIGELSVLTGQMAFANCIVLEPGEVLIVPTDQLRVAMATVPSLSDVLVTAFAMRRKALINVADNTLTLIGPATSQSLLRIAEFVDRNRIPFRWLAPDDPVALDLLHRTEANPYGHVWVIIRNQKALADPTPLRLAKALGLDLGIDQTAPADLIVVGAGPAGLSAAVYGASEGLSTIVVDNVAIGGQAGASSRIENYLGFPTGISGGDLAFRAEVQALKFGARVMVPNNAVALRRKGELFELELEYGKSLSARSVIVATGARYRTLGLPGEGTLSGVYYSATELEARFCSGDPVVVVGGGNSAGQAAMFLSDRSSMVHLVHRRNDLESSMSQYLVSRLQKTPNVTIHLGSAIGELKGERQIGGVTLQDKQSGKLDLDVMRAFRHDRRGSLHVVAAGNDRAGRQRIHPDRSRSSHHRSRQLAHGLRNERARRVCGGRCAQWIGETGCQRSRRRIGGGLGDTSVPGHDTRHDWLIGISPSALHWIRRESFQHDCRCDTARSPGRTHPRCSRPWSACLSSSSTRPRC